MMASMVANGNQDGESVVLKGVDPETCMIVFKNHWAQVVKILEKHDPLRSGSAIPSLSVLSLSAGSIGGPRFGPIPGDEASAVQNYVEHMLFLLMEEESGQGGSMGPILEFVVMENVMERLFVWSLRREFTDDMKLEQLKMYEMLVGQARQPLLHHKPILRPLMMLLSSCSGTTMPVVEAELVLLLNQLCYVLAKDSSILELFFHTSEDQGATNFLIFSLLIPFIHREGKVGQQARDALLLIMSLSAENERVARHISQNTYFCPVLATGLSGLYSSLPTKLEVPNEEWHCLHKEDWLQMPSLIQFLNSLEFCNAVTQVSHPDIRDQLLSYIHNGFLIPVLAPALHKLTLEEVMTTTAYLDLFLRSISEPALLQTFLSFILLHQHENVHILDTLVSRINTPFQLGTVSLALFRTLIGLYCEDVMLQLILRYLIPCNHMMLSQRCVVRERDCYSVSAARILALTPSCCSPDHSPPPLRQLDSILFSKGVETPDSTSLVPSSTEVKEHFSEENDDSGNSCTIGSEIYLDVSYLHYLRDARLNITSCIRACKVWSAPYDGKDPPPEKYQPGVLEEQGLTGRQNQMGLNRAPQLLEPRPQPCPPQNTQPPSVNQLELEWDDSYDACPVQTEEAPAESKPLQEPPAEPPKHIQEMRRTAIMLVKGSYIEENEFQDDVKVYDLVAKKDTKAAEQGKLKPSRSESEGPQGSAEVPLRNGLPTSGMAENGQKNLDTRAKGQTDHNSNLQNTPASELNDDLLAQYEELIHTLDTETGGKPVKADRELKKSVRPVAEDEEEEMDFTSFSAETPEPEKLQLPFGNTFSSRSASRSHSVPFTGPFVSVLLSRLENMLSNSLHVNLLLTGILAQLAAYPQPLLRSFLLNTNLVFQPTVRSLYQVLATVKNQIEQVVATRKDFPELLTAAQHWLLARETSFTAAGDDTPTSRMFLYRNSSSGSIHGEAMRLLKSSPPPKSKAISLDQTEVFATVLFTEFLKELAAFAQEHSILSYIPMEE